MSQESLPSLRKEGVRTADTLTHLQERWPACVGLQFHRPDSIFNCHPVLFREAFPDVSIRDMRRLSLAASLVSGAVLLRDEALDGVSQSDLRLSLLRLQAMEYEAYRIWQKRLPRGSEFWTVYRKLGAEYARVIAEEGCFVKNEKPWSQFTERFAIDLARGNAGLACSTVAALAELNCTRNRMKPLCRSIECYNVARHLWDDVCDWKQDLALGCPSLVLARAVRRRPSLQGREPNQAWLIEFSREVYYGGHLSYVLRLALENLVAAEQAVVDLPRLGWHELLALLRDQCHGLLVDINNIVERRIDVATAAAG